METKTKINFLDSDGYPTEELLKIIEDYQPKDMPILELIDLICNNWHHGDYGYKLHKKYKGKIKLELHTLGWSGNEEIISAIKSNIWLTHFTMRYVKWHTGGHYYFEISCN